MMACIRNNLTFHYDPKTIELALASLAAKHPDATGSVSLGDEPHNWFFEPGNMVGDRAVVREIFKVPEGADASAETDRIVMRLHEIVQMFGGVAGSLIWLAIEFAHSAQDQPLVAEIPVSRQTTNRSADQLTLVWTLGSEV
jgi:hypothetical protein